MTEMAHGWSLPLWEGALAPIAARTLTVPVHVWQWEGPVRVDARLTDGHGNRWEMPLWINVAPWRFYLPGIIKTK